MTTYETNSTGASATSAPKRLGLRAIAAAGGLAVLAGTGTGIASGANAATTSSAATTLAKIKYCESGGNYQAVNSSSGASGAYQFLDSTWKGLSASKGYATASAAPASVQDAAALELYSQMGTSPWAASSGCWSSMTSVPTTSSASTSASSSSTSTSTSTKVSTKVSSATSAAHPAAAAAKAPTGTPHGKPAQMPGAAVKGPMKQGKHVAQPKPPRAPGKPANTMHPKAQHHSKGARTFAAPGR